jgi:Na+-transporting NADH:ubiquinone oxidoreductase subunit NqrC
VTDPQKQFSGTRRDSIRNTLFVAISLSLVCSLLVASTAVLLKPRQLENAERFRQAIVLDVAGLLEPGPDIATLFAGIEVRVVNLADGSYADSIDASEFDARIAEGDPEFAVAIPEASDVANIRRRAQSRATARRSADSGFTNTQKHLVSAIRSTMQSGARSGPANSYTTRMVRCGSRSCAASRRPAMTQFIRSTGSPGPP